jgi:hypothetical protein
MKMAKVKFIKSPTGKFRLAYNIGEVGEVSSKLAKELIEENYAIPFTAPKKETATNKTTKVEKR